MAFNKDAFMRAEYAPRTEEVEVAALAAYFSPDERPVFVLRGLTANQLHKVGTAAVKQQNVENIINAVAQNRDQVNAVRQALGIGDATPAEIVRRLETLVLGVQSPELDLPFAVKLAETHPREFFHLTTRISDLCDKGFELVKPAAASRKTRN